MHAMFTRIYDWHDGIYTSVEWTILNNAIVEHTKYKKLESFVCASTACVHIYVYIIFEGKNTRTNIIYS